MTSFTVNDMSCGHCVRSITQAVQAQDPAAQVVVDLPRHRVDVASAALDAERIRAAIAEAGYTPEPVAG